MSSGAAGTPIDGCSTWVPVCPREPVENPGARLHSGSAVGLHLSWFGASTVGACWMHIHSTRKGTLTVASLDLEQFDAAGDKPPGFRALMLELIECDGCGGTSPPWTARECWRRSRVSVRPVQARFAWRPTASPGHRRPCMPIASRDKTSLHEMHVLVSSRAHSLTLDFRPRCLAKNGVGGRPRGCDESPSLVRSPHET